MIDLEAKLIPKIAERFKNLRKSEYGELPIGVIYPENSSAIYAIERQEHPKGNFVSDTVLEVYSKYFGLTKKELVFGDLDEIKSLSKTIFMDILFPVLAEQLNKLGVFYKKGDFPSPKSQKASIELLCTFGDFSRWYFLRRNNSNYSSDEFVDYFSMMEILWQLCQKRFLIVFEEKLISSICSEEKFRFKTINKRLEIWLNDDFSNVFVPEMIGKFKNNSIFRLGFLVKNLIAEFLVEIPKSYLEEIPIEYNIPPMRTWNIPLTEEKIEKVQKEISNKDTPFEHLFDEIEGATLEHSEEKKGLEKETLDEFLNKMVDMPREFGEIHELDHGRWKIPGILTSNIQAANVFQEVMNDAAEDMIDRLIAVQNYYINCIKWEEIEKFAN